MLFLHGQLEREQATEGVVAGLPNRCARNKQDYGDRERWRHPEGRNDGRIFDERREYSGREGC